jgi:hypothetical protein
MNWFIFSFILGGILVILGIVLLILQEPVGAIIAFAIGAGFLALDFKPTTSIMGEFRGLTTQQLIKKILGAIFIIAALVLFVMEIQRQIGIF